MSQDIAGALEHSLSKVEYLTTFNAFIFGYVVSRYFQEWGRLINQRRSVNFSLEHFAWSFYGFALLIDLWWSGWMRLKYIDRTPFSFYVSILSPFVLYMITSVYFPSLKDREITDLRKYYLFHRKKGFFFYGILFLTVIIASIYVSEARNDIVYGIAGVILMIFAFLSTSRKLEVFIVVLMYGLLIVHGVLMPVYTSPLKWLIKGFAFSEYIVLFITFIYGFIVTKFLSGWTYFVINKNSIRINAMFIAWTLVIFGLMIDYWWGMWERSDTTGYAYIYFLVSLIPVVGFYLISSLLFPEDTLIKGSFVDYFTRNARGIYLLFIMIFLSDFITSWMVGLNILFGVENLFRLLAVILCLAGIVRNTTNMNRFILTFAWILLLTHLIVDYMIN